jgi:hypothetical protein
MCEACFQIHMCERVRLSLEIGLTWHILAAVALILAFLVFFRARKRNREFSTVWKPVFLALVKQRDLSRSVAVRMCACLAEEISEFECLESCEVRFDFSVPMNWQTTSELLKIAFAPEADFLNQFPSCRGNKIRLVHINDTWNMEIVGS